MRLHSRILRPFWVSVTLFLLIGLLAAAAAEPAASNPPRLAVLLIFDQLRGDYLSRWEQLFGEGGFRRLQQDGAWFTNCHYPYSDTFTAAGHASIVTGCSPSEHGIIDNDWFDRAVGKDVYCVISGRYERLPPVLKSEPVSPAEQKRIERTSVSPERLLAPGLGDSLKEATGGKGRVLALCLKDRSAVLAAGRHPDACYWFDSRDGIFVTSSYYGLQLRPWLADPGYTGSQRLGYD